MDKKLLLIILDGFGNAKANDFNAITTANTPSLDNFRAENKESELDASGEKVGLLKNDMGNSEVGHLNIGAGRIVHQLNSLIMAKIEEKSFFKNEALLNAIQHAKNSKLHLLGLLSDGNVHSNIEQLWALLKMCKNEGLQEVYLHAFMDGRDTAPTSGKYFIEQFLLKSKEVGIGKIATISGRYFAMDRDNRWSRIEKAYNTIVHGIGEEFTNPISAIESSYAKNITDEFIIPKIILENGKPVAKIENNDAIISFNFRADRIRQLTHSLKNPQFNEFKTEYFTNLKFVSFSKYDIKLEPFIEIAFRLPKLKNILGEVISKHNLKQLRLAETEKYAHVTFFFNGGNEAIFLNEERILVNSPRVATYDLQPEMSAFKVKDKLISAIKKDEFSFIVTNFANCDMVGHTGIFDATVKAVESVDLCLAEIIPKAQKHNYNIIITADHGNAEKMKEGDGVVFTAHSKNKVPFIVYLNNRNNFEISDGILGDIAPTILDILNIKTPAEMTGKILIKR